MAISDDNLAVDFIDMHCRCNFAESFACCSEKALGSGLSSFRNKYDGSIEGAGLDRLNHMAENQGGPTGFTLRFGMRDKILKVSQICRY
jgi:hypothetical protein